MTSELPDQTQRDRFIRESDRNFSVIAPAGVGKTTAIVDRVVRLALDDPGRDEPVLPKLVVVTYTNAAADEMRERTRRALLEDAGAGAEGLARLDKAFFGTIHSYCLELVRAYGHEAGFPGRPEMTASDELLWVRFIRRHGDLAGILPEVVRKRFLRHVELDEILELSKSLNLPLADDWSAPETPVTEWPPYPDLDFSEVLSHEQTRKSGREKIEADKESLRRWLTLLENSREFLPPFTYTSGAKEFSRKMDDALRPFNAWLSEIAGILARKTAQAYRRFRIEEGRLTFDDIVEMAAWLLRHPGIGRRIRARGTRLILDEAQDTDPVQFTVLTEVARPAGATGRWMEEGGEPPGAGRFCMVGDPQQSIYGGRTNLADYERVNSCLVDSAHGEQLVFSVTMRCDKAIVDGVNQLFPNLLRKTGERGGQVDFVTLQPRPNAGPGQVVRLPVFPREPLPPKPKSAETERAFLEVFADWLSARKPEDFAARSWSQVAVLAPRNNWLAALSEALIIRGMESQNHSTAGLKADDPAVAWFTALATIMSEPENALEIAGVLREIYGVPDHAMAVFCRLWKADKEAFGTVSHPLQILREAAPETLWERLDPRDYILRDALEDLRQCRLAIREMPLRDAATHLVNTTGLRARLRVLDSASPTSPDAALDGLLLRATEAERDRLSLAELARALRRELEDTVDSLTVVRECVQLASCHKAKGLGWDAVILPFFFRQMGTPNARYPRLLRTPDGERIISGKAEMSEEEERFLNHQKRYEQERLLYVAVTRTRKTLVLANDWKIFPQTNRNENSFGKLLLRQSKPEAPQQKQSWDSFPNALRPSDENVETGSQAGSETEAPAETPDAVVMANEMPPSGSQGFEGLLAAARERATGFLQRTTPSSLADHAPVERMNPEDAVEADFEEEYAARQGANYGNWWHDTMETCPWTGEEGARRHFFARRCNPPTCPDPERGAAEVERFCQTSLYSRLTNGELVHLPEAPLFWKAEGLRVYEGFIDMAAWNTFEKRWLVIDWKTDRVDETRLHESFVERYQPQIAVYARALQSITGAPADAAIYATRYGVEVAIDAT